MHVGGAGRRRECAATAATAAGATSAAQRHRDTRRSTTTRTAGERKRQKAAQEGAAQRAERARSGEERYNDLRRSDSRDRRRRGASTWRPTLLVTALQASMTAGAPPGGISSRLRVSANQTAIPSLSGIAHHRIWGSSGNSKPDRQSILLGGCDIRAKGPRGRFYTTRAAI